MKELVGMAARFYYDAIADRDLIVVADCVEKMPQLPKSAKSSSTSELAERKLSILLGKGLGHWLAPFPYIAKPHASSALSCSV